MAAPALTAQQVGEVILFIAPGFFARRAYAWRLPQPRSGQLELVLLSVAMSLPLVALAKPISDGLGVRVNPLGVSYVAILLGLALVVGYVFALIRCSKWTRKALLSLKFPHEPELSILTTVLLRLPVPAWVTVTFKDGRLLAGQPTHGTSDPELSTQHLFLIDAQWWDADKQEWTKPSKEGGTLVNLADVLTIATDKDPA